MTWTDLTTNVTSYISHIKARFPHVDESELRSGTDRAVLINHVAAQHDLTPLEAHQEIDDWLFIESLARQATELRAR